MGSSRSCAHKSATAREAGFTLLEVLVAVAIFAFASVAVLEVRSNSYKEACAAHDFNIARYLLEQQMEAVMLEPDLYEDGDEGSFEDEESDEIKRRYTWRVEIEEINLMGGSSDDEDKDSAADRKKEKKEKKKDKGGDLFGGGSSSDEEEEEQEIKVWKLTVLIEYPGRGENGLTHISATTYLPGDALDSEEVF